MTFQRPFGAPWVDAAAVSGPRSSSRAPLLSLSATATELQVRGMVDRLRDTLLEAGIDEDLRGSITLAASEALNNVAEHAYAGSDPGPVRLDLHLGHDMVHITLRDEGKALPGGTLPPAQLPDRSGPLESLPEGGFGWFLIHDLTHGLTYNRQTGINTLCMSFLMAPSPE